MLTQDNIDQMVTDLRAGRIVTVFYIAHQIELRESYIDELFYKSHSDFRVLPLVVTDVKNAYLEYLNYVNRPEQYHVEQEEVYIDNNVKYVHYYTVKNPKDQYNKEFTAREPSAIYGRKRMIYKDDVLKMEYNDPSFVRPVYTNILTWGNRSQQDCLNIFNNGGLSWKYVKLDEPINADNILYNYVTSNYYVLDTPYFPRIEKHMVNITEKTSFFINKWEAMNYLEELRA